jgi:translation initiation factor 1 (eIF-1/SUI1)
MNPQKIIEQLNEIKIMITSNQFQKEIFTIKNLDELYGVQIVQLTNYLLKSCSLITSQPTGLYSSIELR